MEQMPEYRQSRPLKLQRDLLFDQCETIMDRQRWYAQVGRKGYMHEHKANRMFARFALLGENTGIPMEQRFALFDAAPGGQYPFRPVETP